MKSKTLHCKIKIYKPAASLCQLRREQPGYSASNPGLVESFSGLHTSTHLAETEQRRSARTGIEDCVRGQSGALKTTPPSLPRDCLFPAEEEEDGG